MPVKWTPETDQILLLKILETSDVSPKCVEISEKWPTGQERPTARAISERIVKIRANAKASGSTSHFSISNARSKPSTPRKTLASGTMRKATPKKITGAKAKAGKRKRGGMMGDDEASDDTEANDFKSDDDNNNNASDASDDETPRKKSKANTVAKGKGRDKEFVKVEREEEENGTFDDSSSSYRNPFVEEDDTAVEMVDYA